MCAASEPGDAGIGSVGVAPRATAIHAGTATANAAAAIAIYAVLERVGRRRPNIRVRNATVRLCNGVMVMRAVLGKWAPEDLHVVRTSRPIDGVARAHFREVRVEDVRAMTA